ncbi:MAG TPA: hypothetical protein VFI08_12805 [Spirochaetia bacterium]|nr:hypothetical protein [Spirochaetia bacterium]
MKIDAASLPAPQTPDLVAARTREAAGERENDGDSDDFVKAAAPSASRLNPAGVGTRVDLLA